MGAGVMATQGVRASAPMMFTILIRSNSVPTCYGLMVALFFDPLIIQKKTAGNARFLESEE